MEAIKLVLDVNVALLPANKNILVWGCHFSMCTQIKSNEYIKSNTVIQMQNCRYLKFTVGDSCTYICY